MWFPIHSLMKSNILTSNYSYIVSYSVMRVMCEIIIIDFILLKMIKMLKKRSLHYHSMMVKKSLIEICEVQGISASAFISMCVVRELKRK